jgi:hypothetical protein
MSSGKTSRQENQNNLDKSTLDFNRVEGPDSQKREQGRTYKNLYVKESTQEIDRIKPRNGFTIKEHDCFNRIFGLPEGSLITVSCNNITPNVLAQREEDELNEYINQNFKVIRENPYELQNYRHHPARIEVEINSEEIAQKAFNFRMENGKTWGQL